MSTLLRTDGFMEVCAEEMLSTYFRTVVLAMGVFWSEQVKAIRENLPSHSCKQDTIHFRVGLPLNPHYVSRG